MKRGPLGLNMQRLCNLCHQRVTVQRGGTLQLIRGAKLWVCQKCSAKPRKVTP